MVCDKLQSKHVCIVGAGMAGLASARELRREGHSVVVIEQSHDIGGQWLYDPRIDHEDLLGRTTPLKVHSSMYASLRLISARETMGFSDFPFFAKEGRDTRRFPGHHEVYLYLRDFCEKFGLMEVIRLNTRVEYVGMVSGGKEFGEDMKWVVRSREEGCEEVKEEVFDAVVVATGHYSQPTVPTIKGMDKWSRRQLHSHSYRVPEPFRNEVVVVAGCSDSGKDISLELRKVAKEVHLSTKSLQEVTEGLSKALSKYENLQIHLQIDRLCEDGRVFFVDGSCVVADTIIYCTGYSYSFPFLHTKGLVVVDDNRVGPLYEHTFPPSLAPSLSFVGIPRKVFAPFFFQVQAKWVAEVLSGRRMLPSHDEMMKSVEEYHLSKEIAGMPKRYTHEIANFDYCDKYGEHCDFPHVEEWRKQLCGSSMRNMIANLETFRDQYEDCELVQKGLQSCSLSQLDLQEIVP